MNPHPLPRRWAPRAWALVLLAALPALALAQGPPALDADGDPLPAGAILRIGSARLRTGGSVRSMAFTPDSKKLVTASNPTGFHVWEVPTGKELRTLPSLTKGWLKPMAVSPDGSRAVAIGSDGSSVIGEIATGKLLSSLQPAKRDLFDARFSPDGQWLALVDNHANVHLAKVGAQEWSHRCESPKQKLVSAAAVAFAPDGRSLVVTSVPGPVIHYDATTGKQIRTFEAPKNDNGHHAVACSPDGKRAAAVRRNGAEIHVWEVASGKLVRAIVGESFSLFAVTFTPDSRFLVTGIEEDVGVWEVATGKLVRRLTGHKRTPLALAVAPDGKTLATAGADWTIRLWDWTTALELRPAPSLPALPIDIRFAAHCKTLLLNNRWTWYSWDSTSGQPLGQVALDSMRPAACLSADGRWLALARDSKTVEVREVATKKLALRLDLGEANVVSLLLSDDGKRLAVQVANLITANGVQLWDVPKGARLCEHGCQDCRFSSDGRTLFLSSKAAQQQRVHSYDALTGRKHLRPPLVCPDTAVVVSALHNRLAASLVPGNDTVAVREWATTQAVRQLTVKGRYITRATFAPTGRLLAVAILEGPVVVWDVLTGQELARLDGHRGGGFSLDWSPDGKRLVTGGYDNTMVVWDAEPWHARAASGNESWTGPQLQALWDDLASTDAKRGYAAVEKLVRSPKAAVALLRQQLPPATTTDMAKIMTLAADLGSDKFAVRQKAQAELEKLGEPAGPILERVLDSKPSLEVRQRAEAVLQRLEERAAPPACLRPWRALLVLEMLGTAEARALVDELGGGEPDAWLTREAQAIRQRLSEKGGM